MTIIEALVLGFVMGGAFVAAVGWWFERQAMKVVTIWAFSGKWRACFFALSFVTWIWLYSHGDPAANALPSPIRNRSNSRRLHG